MRLSSSSSKQPRSQRRTVAAVAMPPPSPSPSPQSVRRAAATSYPIHNVRQQLRTLRAERTLYDSEAVYYDQMEELSATLADLTLKRVALDPLEDELCRIDLSAFECREYDV